MKRNLLILLVITALLVITCGNEPPASFYEGTPEDSAAIIAELGAHADFLKTDDICAGLYADVTIEAVSWVTSDLFFRATDPIIKQHIDSIADVLSETARFQDLWYTKDTTCTVYLFDTFTVVEQYHWDVRYSGHYDKDSITPTGETLHVLGTIDTNTTGGFDEITPVYAEGLRHLYLEPVREMAIDGSDTTYPMAEPREWTLKRISYGNYFYPNEGAEYPIIAEVRLTHADGSVDTIQDYVTDTLFTGHAMNRMKHIDSLLQLTAGETLNVYIMLGGATIDSTMTLYFAGAEGARSKITSGHGDFVVPSPSSSTGIMNLFFEVILKDSYYYVDPPKDYLAMAWMVPVIIQ